MALRLNFWSRSTSETVRVQLPTDVVHASFGEPDFGEPRGDATALATVLTFLGDHTDRHEQGTWIDLDGPNYRDHADSERVLTTFDHDEPDAEAQYVSVVRSERVWDCGTVGCLAGWTALLAGWRPTLEFDGVYRDGVVRPVSDVARELLNLNVNQANALFAGTNTLEDLWEYADQFTNGEASRRANALYAEHGHDPIEFTPQLLTAPAQLTLAAAVPEVEVEVEVGGSETSTSRELESVR